MFSIDEIIEIRKLVMDKFGVKLHYHDTCGGQYFSLDEPDELIQNFIENYAAGKNLKALFSDDGRNISVEKC